MLKSDHTPYRIYCAGPLFNPSERAEMEMLAETLEQAGFKTFLPQRDGFLYAAMLPHIFRAGYARDVAQWMVRQAIFALDVYQMLVACEGTVVNLNGRVPDEGAIVEGSMAWMAGKAVVLFKDDGRSLIDGLDNPLLAGLGDFRVVRRSEDLPMRLTRALAECQPTALQVESLPLTVQPVLARGQRLTEVNAKGDAGQLVQVILEFFDEFRGNAGRAVHSRR
jgi:nucleoside 2-deoxyribosyltransferase